MLMMHALAGPLSKKLSQLMLMMLALAGPLGTTVYQMLVLMMLALAAPLVEHVQADADDVDLPAMLIIVLPSGAHDAFSYCSS